MTTRIGISDKCTGHGRCYVLAPDLFEPDDEGYGVVTRAEVNDSEDAAAARLAIDACPEGAISETEA